MILSNFVWAPSWLRPLKRVKDVYLLGCISWEACSLSFLRTIGVDFTVMFSDSPYRVCLQNLWCNGVHFPLRPPKAVFFHHGTSQCYFMWTALSEPHNKGLLNNGNLPVRHWNSCYAFVKDASLPKWQIKAQMLCLATVGSKHLSH